jgi:hypothetical protein
MGKYANKVNAYAQDLAYSKVYKKQKRLQSYGQTAYMLNVTINKFMRDVEKKAIKLIAKLEATRVAELQQELARLQTKTV